MGWGRTLRCQVSSHSYKILRCFKRMFQVYVQVFRVKSSQVLSCIALRKSKRFKRHEDRTLGHGTCMELVQPVVTADPFLKYQF